MAFNIKDFRQAMQFDGQRPNLFEIEITGTGNNADFKDLNLFAKGGSIPGATLGTIIVPYFGREVKFAGNRTFPEWTVTVINDETFAVRSQFEEWMNKINDHATNRRNAGSESGNYVGLGKVTQWGKDGTTKTVTYNFHNMFPTDISEITLDWGDNDTIEEYTITFAYDFWSRLKPTRIGAKGPTSQGTITGPEF